ncbi:PrgI family protein [Patescibacteria group bacterium]|nr:PrgI family protein [Patescibacteria group bacterium]
MAYIVPKFIEREPKIVGPLTLKQFFFFVAAGAVGFILYSAFGKKNPFLFLVLMIGVVGFSFILAFANVGGRPFPIFLKNFFTFTLAQKFFTFKKKLFAPRLFPEEIPKLKETKVSYPLGTSKSSLQNLSTKVETKTR